MPTATGAVPVASAISRRSRSARGTRPVRQAPGRRAPAARRGVRRCCSASVSVGTSSAACAPASTVWQIASAATTVCQADLALKEAPHRALAVQVAADLAHRAPLLGLGSGTAAPSRAPTAPRRPRPPRRGAGGSWPAGPRAARAAARSARPARAASRCASARERGSGPPPASPRRRRSAGARASTPGGARAPPGRAAAPGRPARGCGKAGAARWPGRPATPACGRPPTPARRAPHASARPSPPPRRRSARAAGLVAGCRIRARCSWLVHTATMRPLSSWTRARTRRRLRRRAGPRCRQAHPQSPHRPR